MLNKTFKQYKNSNTKSLFINYLRSNRLLSSNMRKYLPNEILTNSSALLLPLVDTLVVGNLIGDDALAAVSLTAPIFLLCSIITRILSSGLSKTISVYLGRNDKEGINRCYIANRMILIFGFIFSFLIQIPIAYVVFKTYSFKSNNYGMVWAYFLGSMIGAPFDFVKSICVNNLRSFGKITNLSRLTIAVQLINLVGDIVLIRFCNLGIYGAGFATSISQIVFGVTSYVLVIKKTDINKFEKKPWIREMKNIFKTGFPRGLRVGLNALQSWVLSCVVLYSLDMSGMAVKAACTSCYNILSIIFLSYSEIMQPLASVLHGAEDKASSRNLITYSLSRGVSITLFLQLLIEFFPAAFLGMYGIKSPDASQIAVLRIFASFIFLSAGINMIIDYFSSVEKSGIASILTSLNGAPVFTPILLLLSVTLGGIYVWYAYLFTALIAGTAAVWYLWKYFHEELRTDKTQNLELYLSLLPEDGVKISELMIQHFNKKGEYVKIGNHIAIFLEELTTHVRVHNKKARIDILIKEDENAFVLLMFDNGAFRDYQFDLEDAKLYSRLRIARLVSSEVFYRNVLGLNYVSSSFAKEIAA